MTLITPEVAGQAPAIEALLDRTFGPERHLKTAQRLRDNRLPADRLSFVATEDSTLLGTLRFWHVRLGSGGDALLLGPIAVEPEAQSRGIGKMLIQRGLTDARRLGHRAVILVGDAVYYRKFGFRCDVTRRLTLPGPVDTSRFMGLELEEDAMVGVKGYVRGTGAFASNGNALDWAA